MTYYTATFTGIAVSAAQDLFEIVAPATSRVVIHDLALAQYSDPDATTEAEILSLQIIRGHTTSGSGGAAVTPGALNPYLRAAASTVERNNTTVAANGTAVTLWSDGWHTQAGFIWRLSERFVGMKNENKILLRPSERLVVRLPVAPADAITTNGTLAFEEIGVVPVA